VIMIVIMIISGSIKMIKKGKNLLVLLLLLLLLPTSISLKNGEDILLRSQGWQSGRGEEYSQEESLSECQLEE